MVEVYWKIVKFNTKNKVELKKSSIEYMEEIKKHFGLSLYDTLIYE